MMKHLQLQMQLQYNCYYSTMQYNCNCCYAISYNNELHWYIFVSKFADEMIFLSRFYQVLSSAFSHTFFNILTVDLRHACEWIKYLNKENDNCIIVNKEFIHFKNLQNWWCIQNMNYYFQSHILFLRHVLCK